MYTHFSQESLSLLHITGDFSSGKSLPMDDVRVIVVNIQRQNEHISSPLFCEVS
jgi:hypothetical protein